MEDRVPWAWARIQVEHAVGIRAALPILRIAMADLMALPEFHPPVVVIPLPPADASHLIERARFNLHRGVPAHIAPPCWVVGDPPSAPGRFADWWAVEVEELLVVSGW
jgi:hypothetical protein